MKIYHLDFGKTGTGVSGGEICMIELIRSFAARGLKNVILTTDNGRDTYRKQSLLESDAIGYRVIESFAFEQRHHVFISYVVRTFSALALIKEIRTELADDDILMCHSDFFPTTMAFRALSRGRDPKSLFYWFHMFAPRLFRGFKGEFTGRWSIPTIANIHYLLNQVIFFALIRPQAMIITVNSYYRDRLVSRAPRNPVHVVTHFGGVAEPITPTGSQRDYDLVWMGRFHPQKGIEELADILLRLTSRGIAIRVAIIGGGNAEYERMVRSLETRSAGSAVHVDYLGFISGSDRFKMLLRSRLFLMTSLYESYGLVNIEAMRCGCPVVAYALPIFDVFTEGMVRVPVRDNGAMVDVIANLLSDPERLSKLSAEASAFAAARSWDITADEIISLINI